MANWRVARIVARLAHHGQTDLQGEPYIHHVDRVAACLTDDFKAVAYLHDVLEDSDVSTWDLRELGFEEDVLEAVWFLTRTEKSYEDYIESIRRAKGPAGELARTVKLADLRDNLSRVDGLEKVTRERLRARYEKALEVLS